jgi:ATP-dependent Clp protease ATP-binding subunit ClpC
MAIRTDHWDFWETCTWMSHATERARRVLFFAAQEAARHGSARIDSEHLLLALIREDGNVLKIFLSKPESIQAVRQEIERRITTGEREPINIVLSETSERILAFAAEEAKRLNMQHLGTEHLLLGILREVKCIATEVLHDSGLTLEKTRETLANSLDQVRGRTLRTRPPT